jgi:hypothetical protein
MKSGTMVIRWVGIVALAGSLACGSNKCSADNPGGVCAAGTCVSGTCCAAASICGGTCCTAAETCSNGYCCLTSDPQTLDAGCNIGSAGQCVVWGRLAASDLASVQGVCTHNGGTWLAAPCSDAGLVGMCTIPPLDPNTGVTCSPSGTILQHYYTPSYTQSSARGACSGAPGTTFIPFP